MLEKGVFMDTEEVFITSIIEWLSFPLDVPFIDAEIECDYTTFCSLQDDRIHSDESINSILYSELESLELANCIKLIAGENRQYHDNPFGGPSIRFVYLLSFQQTNIPKINMFKEG